MTLWKQVTYYEQEYKASTNGEIINIKTNKQVVPFHRDINDKHLSVILTKNSIQHKLGLHRVIATTFIPNPGLLTVVHHKDSNPLNNNTDNLMWVSNRYNVALGNNRITYIIYIYSKGSNIIKTFYTKKSLIEDLDIRFATGWEFLLKYLSKEDSNRYSMSEVVYNWLKQDDLNKRHKEYISYKNKNNANNKRRSKVQVWLESLDDEELSEVEIDIENMSQSKFKTKYHRDKRSINNHLTNEQHMI